MLKLCTTLLGHRVLAFHKSQLLMPLIDLNIIDSKLSSLILRHISDLDLCDAVQAHIRILHATERLDRVLHNLMMVHMYLLFNVFYFVV